jgi:ATP-dependent DNA helicase DinG
LPEPSEETEKYIPAISRRIWDLIFASGGRTFVLFTSYDSLNRVYKEIEEISSKFPLIKQGEMPAAKMIEEFKKKPSVILATNSFWQGVDIPGEALQSVIITKLPFDVPTDPITEARMESFRKQNKNPFRYYQLPRAIIQLKQGFGRLIRKQTDIGVASILDTRLINRSYGKQFVESLPDSKRTDDLETVKNFFQKNNLEVKKALPSPGLKAQIVDLDSRR